MRVRQEAASRCHHLAMLAPATAGVERVFQRGGLEAQPCQRRGSQALQPGPPFREPHQTADMLGAGMTARREKDPIL